MKIRRSIFHFITLQKRNFLGRWLGSISNSIRNALENKMNDNELSGEYKIVRKFSDLNPKIVFDVGANVGIWTKEFKKYSTNSKIYLFEPIPNTFQELKMNISELEEVYPNQYALSNYSGTMEFNYYPLTSFFSSIYTTNLGKNPIKIVVESITGDEFCSKNTIDHIDILKIDVEGAENLVLQGFSRMLIEKKIDIIQFEYGPLNINSKFLLKDFYELFTDYGYKVGKIYPNWIDWSGYRIDKENFILSNFIGISDERYESIFG